MNIRSVKLSDYTTIKLGGMSNKFIECINEDDILEAVAYAKKNKLSIQVLGGGSNTIFPDEGFTGVILYINTKGIKKSGSIFSVKAGEKWDEFVEHTINLNYSGLECLSGIPGSTGATPIQNVGAYGQEVSNAIHYIKTVNIQTLQFMEFSNNECGFSYRNSRFKSQDKNKYIITEVLFALNPSGETKIEYKELIEYLETYPQYNLFSNSDKLKAIREATLNIRRKKSMVYDENDGDSYSCGSFFTNPILNSKQFEKFCNICLEFGLESKSYKNGEEFKISAGWLIENSGFYKGFTENGIGISNKHSLAIVNRGGSTKDLICFAEKIKEEVLKKFTISLELEPELVSR
jgi:UDP-N-acetylmuramate dehydrogenase